METSLFKLELTLLNFTQREYTVPDEVKLKIGRDPGNDIVISESTVSRYHASIARRGGIMVIFDRGSKNGTFVNGKKVHSAELKDGDTIRIGARYNLKVSVASSRERLSTVTANPQSQEEANP